MWWVDNLDDTITVIFWNVRRTVDLYFWHFDIRKLADSDLTMPLPTVSTLLGFFNPAAYTITRPSLLTYGTLVHYSSSHK